ncbi:hypothetical protein K505DRAFT_334902 [Melanomma pulvis-pyrius CBS 109.77]|uniref:Uncharacterized protein n=1 Tax=Melanomma pulvis-pyrius CBS 109.77 TaxID=1314802 RepID=A0A6A6XLF3_9PLEO|nr:hypothetical protein K505DRAFT_334902 [Melanomma pulvis-pyrius CBS 109.77]
MNFQLQQTEAFQPPTAVVMHLHRLTSNFTHTKLITCLISFFLFTNYTFAAEHRVHGGSLNRIRSSQSNGYEPDKSTSENNDILDDDILSRIYEHINVTEERSNSTSDHHVLKKSHHDQKRDEPGFADEDDFDDLEVTPDQPFVEALIQGEDLENSYYRKNILGIARENFFYPTEKNFYESRALEFFARWTIESQPRWHEKLKTDKTLSQLTFFAMDTVGPQYRSMECDIEFEQGCRNMPTPLEVRAVYPEERHRAREIIFTLDITRKAYSDMFHFKRALIAARERLPDFCPEFARVFFHEATYHKKKMCVATIINILMSVIMSLLTVFTFGQSLWGIIGSVGALAAEGLMEGFAAVATVGLVEGVTEAAAEVGVEVGLSSAFLGVGTAVGSTEALVEGAAAAGLGTVEALTEGGAAAGLGTVEALAEGGTAAGLGSFEAVVEGSTAAGFGTGEVLAEGGTAAGFGAEEVAVEVTSESLFRVDSIMSTAEGVGKAAGQSMAEATVQTVETTIEETGLGSILEGASIEGTIEESGIRPILEGASVGGTIAHGTAQGSGQGTSGPGTPSQDTPSQGRRPSFRFDPSTREDLLSGLRETIRTESTVDLHLPGQRPIRWYAPWSSPGTNFHTYIQTIHSQITEMIHRTLHLRPQGSSSHGSSTDSSSLPPDSLDVPVRLPGEQRPDRTRPGPANQGPPPRLQIPETIEEGDEGFGQFDGPSEGRPPNIYGPRSRGPQINRQPMQRASRLRRAFRWLINLFRPSSRELAEWERNFDRWAESQPSSGGFEEALRNLQEQARTRKPGRTKNKPNNRKPKPNNGKSKLNNGKSFGRTERRDDMFTQPKLATTTDPLHYRVTVGQFETFNYDDLEDGNLRSVYDAPSMQSGFFTIATEKYTATELVSPGGSLESSDSRATQKRSDPTPSTNSNSTTPTHNNSKTWKRKLSKRTKHMVNRNTPLFAMIPNKGDLSAGNPRSNDLWDLGARLTQRFMYPNGTLMKARDGPAFLSDNSFAIAYYIEQLRKPDKEFRDVDDIAQVLDGMQSSTEIPAWKIVNAVKHTPWSSALGSMNFKGSHAEGKESNPMLQFEWGAAQHTFTKRLAPEHKHVVARTSSESQKKAVVYEYVMGYRPAQLDSLGFMRQLSALKLASPRQGRKRSAEGWIFDQDQGTNRKIFNARMRNERFQNDIRHEECSTDNYTGDTKKNEKKCRKLLQEVCDSALNRIQASLWEINDPEWVKRNWVAGEASPVALYLQDRYSTYANYIAFQSIQLNPKALENSLFQNLKNSLVTKAYADEQCYLKCSTNSHPGISSGGNVHQFGDATCMSGCFDPTEQRSEQLYGLDHRKGYLGAEKEPWNLNETLISAESYSRYQSRDPIGYLPGDFELNPYEASVRDKTPILPVCKGDYIKLADDYVKGIGQFPCSCGNKYGSESARFWSASNWAGGQKKNEYKYIMDCRDGPLKSLIDQYPAAYMINMCQAILTIAPPGTGSYQEKKNKGSYSQNVLACNKFMQYYRDNSRQSDQFLDENMCKLWSKYSDNWHRGGNKKHQDFSYVNHDLSHGGCKKWKKYWKKTCKKGRRTCDFPSGY